jgi:hypothetical protein
MVKLLFKILRKKQCFFSKLNIKTGLKKVRIVFFNQKKNITNYNFNFQQFTIIEF